MVPLLVTLFIIICVLLMVVVLLQKGRGGGLGAAFGGAGSSAFGTRTGDVFTWVTIVLTALFLMLAVVIALAIRPEQTVTAMPLFDPAPTDISEPVKVRINSTTPRAKIYYTIDGGQPGQNSSLYVKDPVSVEPRQTLRAIAYGPDSSWKPSQVNVGYYGPPAQTQPGAMPILLPQTAPAGENPPAVPPAPEPPAELPAGAVPATAP